MRTLVSYAGSGIFAQQIALAFLENDALGAFATTFAYDDSNGVGWALASIQAEFAQKIRRDLKRREISLVPMRYVKTIPFWELVRTAFSRSGASTTLVDRIWDHMSLSFDRNVARRYVPGAEAVYAYEYTALESLRRSRQEGGAAILDLPSLNSRAFNAIQDAERRKHPLLQSRGDNYFRDRFERRQARREEEVELANVIVTNSNLTRQSYLDSGVDPAKIIAVPLAAPPCIADIERDFRSDSPLRIIWAGSFSIGKGAHYFIDAWRQLDPRGQVTACIYGSYNLPMGFRAQLPEDISFQQTIPQPRLFAEFQKADILVLPTLSDGFGMVVAEAFANGLPVITTDRAGAVELVRHGENGLIIPAGDPVALKEALQWCIDNRRRVHEMRFAAVATARQWQWPDYRRAFIESLGGALLRTGFKPSFAKA